MKNIFFIIFALGIIGFFCLHFVTDIGTVHATGWLGGYSYHKSLVVTSSSTAPGVNYVPTIKISPYSNPISTASSSWTVNGTTFHYRIAIPVTEDNGATLANYYVRMQVNTIWLNNNGYFRSGGAGDEAEFTNSAGTVLPYYYDTTLFNQASSTYWVKMSLGIGQSTTTYMYFDPNAATSTSYTPVSVTTNGYSSSTTVQVSATGDDMRYYTTTYASTTCATSTSYAWFDGGDDGLGYTGRSSARFLNVSIPRAATITSSSLTLVAYNAQSATTTRTYIHGEAADNAPQITTCSDFLNRTRTTASTEWDSIPSWTASSTYVSPDLSAPIQEIVNRSGWASGNTLQFFWENNSSNSSTVGAYRTAYSYYLSSTLAPKL